MPSRGPLPGGLAHGCDESHALIPPSLVFSSHVSVNRTLSPPPAAACGEDLGRGSASFSPRHQGQPGTLCSARCTDKPNWVLCGPRSSSPGHRGACSEVPHVEDALERTVLPPLAPPQDGGGCCPRCPLGLLGLGCWAEPCGLSVPQGLPATRGLAVTAAAAVGARPSERPTGSCRAAAPAPPGGSPSSPHEDGTCPKAAQTLPVSCPHGVRWGRDPDQAGGRGQG